MHNFMHFFTLRAILMTILFEILPLTRVQTTTKARQQILISLKWRLEFSAALHVPHVHQLSHCFPQGGIWLLHGIITGNLSQTLHEPYFSLTNI
jgi:hypothetical protein